MALRTQRFGVRNAAGARSSEWVVIWKTNTSDVYFATHTLGGTMKVSFHESGRCHVRAPRPEYWRGAGEPPEFLLAWDIDPCANYNFPFSVMVPEQELRIAEWAKHKDKRTTGYKHHLAREWKLPSSSCALPMTYLFRYNPWDGIHISSMHRYRMDDD